MPHSIANRLRKVAGNRRHARRRKTRRKVRISFSPSFAGTVGGSEEASAARIEGYTLDISTVGLALVIPSLPASQETILGDDAEIDITIELPVASVKMHAIAVRCEPMRHPQPGYLVGARITEMSDGDRARLVEYLQRLKLSVGNFAP